MKILNLGEFGNLPKNIAEKSAEPRIAKFGGVVITSGLALKVYDMVTPNNMKNPVDEAKSFLEEEIKGGRIPSLSGLGFAILSYDMLNAVRWDNEYPHVTKNILYEYHGGFGKDADIVKHSIDDAGAFCLWEERIVAEEGRAWLRYLKSERTETDKEVYLYDFITGAL
jgi:hypothetical protein